MKKILYILLFLPQLIYSQGVEKINNGDFSSSTGWDTNTPVTIAAGVATFDGTNWGTLDQTSANMITPIQANTEYTFSFDITDSDDGITYFSLQSITNNTYISSTMYSDGSYTTIFTTPANIGDGGIRFYSSSNFTIDNISLIQHADIGDDPYYVATDGNDAASGSIDNPWASFNRAISIAEAGDTIYFRGGTYYPDEPFIIDAYNGVGNNGTANNYIYYLNYPGEEPIFDFINYTHTGSNQWSALGINYSTYLYFKGFTIRNVKQGALGQSAFGIDCYGASNLTFENLTVHRIGGRAFGFFGGFGAHDPNGSETTQAIPDVPADTVKYINCDAYDNIDSVDIGSNIGGLADGWKFNNQAGSYVLFYGCRAWDNSDDGFDPNGGVTIHMENCWTWNNGRENGDGYGIKTIGLNSFFYPETVPLPGGGSLPDTTIFTRKFYNNIIAFNRHVGFSLGMRADWWLPSTHLYNNLSYANNGNGFSQGQPGLEPYGSVIWHNNLSYGNELNVLNHSVYTGSHNSFDMGYPWEDSIAITSTDFAATLDSATIISQLTAPRKADGSLPDITVFKLTEDSWMKSAGTDVGFSDVPDIGVDWDYLDAGSAPVDPPASIRRPKPGRSAGGTSVLNGKVLIF